MGFFDNVPLAPPNSILGTAQECKNDPFPEKINLTIGAYRTEEGAPYVLPTVRKAEEEMLSEHQDHEYLGQDGLIEFTSVAKKLMFGDDSKLISENRVHSIQSIGGTGTLRLISSFLKSVMPDSLCLIPEVTWPNHPVVLTASGITHGKYRYLDESGCALNFSGMIEDIKAAPVGSMILFHSCAHNPSGVDPNEEQWREILEVVKANNLFPFFDNAYQGFVSGCPIKDAFAVRLFADAGLELVVACSFSKNFGLYGERLGCLHVVTSTEDQCVRVGSQLKALARSLYSTCPSYGARIVARILGDPVSKVAWEAECASMANRLTHVRHSLFDALTAQNVQGTWDHIIAQQGMFSFTGIAKEAVLRLKTEFHIYMLMDGRISLAGLNQSNIGRFVESLKEILGTNSNK
jgi:aspartate/tyrosine/aromatic aminotransferase